MLLLAVLACVQLTSTYQEQQQYWLLLLLQNE
jgi:hypothetical protein